MSKKYTKFYRLVSIVENDSAYSIKLDERLLKSPAGHIIKVPTLALAKLLEAEWAGQAEEINLGSMPATRLINTGLDMWQEGGADALIEDILRFAAHDSILYRVDSPIEFANQQAELLDPVVDWIKESTGAFFVTSTSLQHSLQPMSAINLFGRKLKQIENIFYLLALHSITQLTNSALLSIALSEDFIDVQQCVEYANSELYWNIKQYGLDPEIEQQLQIQKQEIANAYQLIKACA